MDAKERNEIPPFRRLLLRPPLLQPSLKTDPTVCVCVHFSQSATAYGRIGSLFGVALVMEKFAKILQPNTQLPNERTHTHTQNSSEHASQLRELRVANSELSRNANLTVLFLPFFL